MKYVQYFKTQNDVNLNEYYPKVAYCEELNNLTILNSSESPSNVSVLLINGKLVNKRDIPSDGYSKDEVVGFAIQGYDHDILVYPDITDKCWFCGGNNKCDNYELIPSSSNIDVAIKDLDGEGNTIKLCQSLTYQPWACNVAKNTTWKDGRTGYLMSLGEGQLIEKELRDLNEIRLRCGCDEIPNQSYWTSTLNSKTEEGYLKATWLHNFRGYRDGVNVQGYLNILPIAKLNE